MFTKSNSIKTAKGHNLENYNPINPIFELIRDVMDVKQNFKFNQNLLIFTQVIVFTRSNIIETAKGHNSENNNQIGLIVELIRDVIDIRLHTKFHKNPIIFTQVIVFTRKS